MIVQIYEIQTPQEAEKIIEMGADHVGSVILSSCEWKSTDIRETIRTTESLGAKSSLLTLFSDKDSVLRCLDYYGPDIIHFCEAIFPFDNIEKTCSSLIELQQMVREKFPEIKIMRSIPIPMEGASIKIPFLDIAEFFEPYSDFFLTDTFLEYEGNADSDIQPVPGYVGITGMVCDPLKSRELVEKSKIPVILAGGLSPENVFDLSQIIKPYGVDSCTLTNAHDAEGKPLRFKKDLHRVSAFVNEAKRAALKPNSK